MMILTQPIKKTRSVSKNSDTNIDLFQNGDNWTQHEGEFKWWEWTYQANVAGFDIDVLVDVQLSKTDSKNSSWKVLGLDQPDLGLGREYLINGFDDKVGFSELSVYLCLSIYVYMSICRSVYMSLSIFVTLSPCLYVYLALC